MSDLREVDLIPGTGNERVFNEPWEARAFAIAIELNNKGLFTWGEWAEQFGPLLKANDKLPLPLSYYHVWLQNLEAVVAKKGMASDTERQRRKREWEIAAARTPHGMPIEL